MEIPPPGQCFGGPEVVRRGKLAGRLTWQRPRQESTFESYKHTPSLFSSVDHVPLPAPQSAKEEGSGAKRPFAPTTEEQAAAAASRRAEFCPRGQLVLLLGNTVAAVAAGDLGVLFRHLTPEGDAKFADCAGHVLSICVVHEHGEGGSQAGGGGERLLATLVGGAVAVLVVKVGSQSGELSVDVSFRAELFEAFTGDLWALAARGGPGDDVHAIVHRRAALENGEPCTEVAVARVGGGSGGSILVRLRGACPPSGASWCADGQALIAADGSGYSLPGEPWPMEEDTAVVTSLRWSGPEGGDSPGPAAQVATWALPAGDLLAAYPSVEDGVVLTIIHGSGGWRGSATALAVSSAGAPCSGGGAPEPQVDVRAEIPGIAACASVRSGLRLLARSPKGTFVMLMEAFGSNAVNVFRDPEGAALAATAILHLPAGPGAGAEEGEEVLGAVLTDQAVVTLMRDKLVVGALDFSAAPAPRAPERSVPPADLPMGIKREALLRMLDARGED